MAATVVDYSMARPGGLRLRQAGYTAALRYLGADSRCITPGELADLHGAGLGVGLIWETSQGRSLGGAPAGTQDADAANWWADQLPAPSWVPIAATVDFGPTQAQLDGPVTDYFRAFAARSKRPAACYGPYDAIETIVGRGIVPWGWQSAGNSGGGQGTGGQIQTGYPNPVRLSQHAHLFQHFGRTVIADTDHNEVLKPAPLWWRAGQTEPEGDDELTPDDRAYIAQLISDKDTRDAAVLPKLVGEEVQWRLTNSDGKAPVTTMSDGSGGQIGVTLTQIIVMLQALGGLGATVDALKEIVSHLDQGDAPSATAVAKELLDQLAALLTPAVTPPKDTA